MNRAHRSCPCMLKWMESLEIAVVIYRPGNVDRSRKKSVWLSIDKTIDIRDLTYSMKKRLLTKSSVSSTSNH